MADGKENYLLDLGCDKAKEYGTFNSKIFKGGVAVSVGCDIKMGLMIRIIAKMF